MNPHHIDAQEAWGEDACRRAARLDFLTNEQAETCDGGEHRCEFCPWRDPLQSPATGDRVTLANGRRIEVDYVNMHHTVHPMLRFNYLDIRRGRASWEIKLSDWYSKTEGATVDQVGRKPWGFDIKGRGNRTAEQRIAFLTANRKATSVLAQSVVARVRADIEKLAASKEKAS